MVAEYHHVRIKVVSVKGKCDNGHKVGDEWVILKKSPGGLCLHALNSMLWALKVLSFGGTFPWANDDPDTLLVACPDPENAVVYELKRLAEKPE